MHRSTDVYKLMLVANTSNYLTVPKGLHLDIGTKYRFDLQYESEPILKFHLFELRKDEEDTDTTVATTVVNNNHRIRIPANIANRLRLMPGTLFKAEYMLHPRQLTYSHISEQEELQLWEKRKRVNLEEKKKKKTEPQETYLQKKEREAYEKIRIRDLIKIRFINREEIIFNLGDKEMRIPAPKNISKVGNDTLAKSYLILNHWEELTNAAEPQ